MKKYILLIVVLTSFIRADSATIPVTTPISQSLVNPAYPLIYFSTLSMKEVQKLAGRKLKLKEKIAVKLIQWKIKKEINGKKAADYKDKGKTALIFGIISLALILLTPLLFFGPLASLAFAIAALITGKKALKANRNDSKAKTGIILGWITVGLILILAVLIGIAIATWSWGWG